MNGDLKVVKKFLGSGQGFGADDRENFAGAHLGQKLDGRGTDAAGGTENEGTRVVDGVGGV